MRYYKITPQEADLIGSFVCPDGSVFEPKAGEQMDGSFIVGEDKYNDLIDTEQFLRINWNEKTLIEQTDLNPKKYE